MKQKFDSGPERLYSFSDGVFAVIITVLVLELRPPEHSTWVAVFTLWPTAAAYAVSYVFVAIVWVNHHHLLRFATAPTTRLIWVNFAHLFTVSLIPFTTAWVATSKLDSAPVCMYAAVFAVVNATYIFLCAEAVDRVDEKVVPFRVRGLMRMRSLMTLLAFAVAGVLALWNPFVGFALVCGSLLTYLRPDAGM